jgi:hypothetical protein
LLATFDCRISLAIIENGVVSYFNFDVLMSSLMHYEAIDSVVESDVVNELKSALISKVACDVDT